MFYHKKSMSVLSIFLAIFLMKGYGQFSQKKDISNEDIAGWSYLSQEIKLSDDGRFIVYGFANADLKGKVGYVKEIDGQWIQMIDNFSNLKYSFDPTSKFLIYQTVEEIRIQELGTSKLRAFDATLDFTPTFTNYLGESALIYCAQGKSKTKSLFVRTFRSAKQKEFQNVLSVWVSPNGEDILFTKNVENSQVLYRFDTKSGEVLRIFSGTKIESIIFGKSKKVLSFIDRIGKRSNIFYVDIKRSLILKVFDDTSFKFGEKELKVIAIDRFVANDVNLLFTLGEDKIESNQNEKPILKIWSYGDKLFTGDSKKTTSFMALTLIGKKNATIVYDYDNLSEISVSDNLLLITKKDNINSSVTWNRFQARSYISLISTENGGVKSLESLDLILNAHGTDWADLSPDGRYFVFYSKKDKSFYKFDVDTGNLERLTYIKFEGDGNLPLTFLSSGDFLVKDLYDIWQINITKKKEPICLSGSIGSTNKLSFSILDGKSKLYNNQDSILTVVYDFKTRKNGFAWLKVGMVRKPEKLLFDEDYYYYPNIDAHFQYLPVKAKNIGRYLLVRQNYDSSPNIYITNNFKNLIQITSHFPERKYKWCSTQLIHWKNESDSGSAVLFKPSDFDINKKYPVIVTYYEQLGHKYNTYPFLEKNINGSIDDVSVLVRHGYLVLCPDIRRAEIGNTGNEAFRAIMGSTNELIKFPFVNPEKIGTHGFSFGGFEANYLITRTNRFKAAFEASGVTNLVSLNGNVRMGKPSTFINEEGQNKLGKSMWDSPAIYLENSSVFYADKIQTPLLMMHNRNDPAVPFSQGIELFGALYRLGKPAWLLEYSDGWHYLRNEDAKNDLTKRVFQFFDHYLKNAPAPQWMLNQMSSNEKVSSFGFLLDSTGKTPGPGVLTTSEKTKIDEYSKIPLSEKLKRIKD